MFPCNLSPKLFLLPILFSSQACVFKPQSPGQAQDAEEGKNLLKDGYSLLEAAQEGDVTKVCAGSVSLHPSHFPPYIQPCSQNARTLIAPRPALLSPRFEVTALST